ncbi:MAG: sulfite exporter TauE/SafE family protein [Clostridia bacterium]
MTTSTIFATVLFMGFSCSMGCGTVNTPFLLGSLLGDGTSIDQSRKSIMLFSLGKIISLMIMGFLSAVFGSIILTYVQTLYPDATIWIIRITTIIFGARILYFTIKNEFLPKKDDEPTGCSSCAGCPSSKGCSSVKTEQKIPKSYFIAGLLYATIPCGPLLTTLTYASTMNIFTAMLLLGLFGLVNSLIPVFFFASLVGMANAEFTKNSTNFLRYVKLSGGAILVYAAIFRVY